MKINQNYLKLQNNYLFSTTAKKIADFRRENPSLEVYKLSIGDVTLPLCPAVIRALEEATAEMSQQDTFRGYGPEQGYDFLRNSLKQYYARRGVELAADEIFVSDGAKSDLGNLPDIFDVGNTALIPDPVYPAYMDVNVMLGRKVLTAKGNKDNGFKPMPEQAYVADIIYLCSPNNPTGAVYTKEELKQWVDFANQNGSIIFFDAAYECFIADDSLPRSIYEIEGAKTCAIEISSFSKTAGFTGTRCGYTVVPHTLVADGVELNKLWNRRQCTKFNGVPYTVQRAAAAVFSDEGQQQVKQNIAYYMDNARIIHEALSELGVWHTGGINSPYIWLECPKGIDSWTFFDLLLTKAQVAGTPGAGFGEQGEGYFRLTAFGDKQKTITAVERMAELLKTL